MPETLNHYGVKSIPRESRFTKPVYLSSLPGGRRFLLLTPELPFTEDLGRTLLTWSFKDISSTGALRSTDLPTLLETAVPPPPEPVKEPEPLIDPRLRKVMTFYAEFQLFTTRVFYQAAGEPSFSEVAEHIRDLCQLLRAEPRLLFQVNNQDPAPNADYLPTHAVKSTVTALFIGSSLKLPVHQLIELGCAALVHEIGFVRLPAQIYLARGQLKPEEEKLLLSHPMMSALILKNAGWPVTIIQAAQQHHEREDGSGYPQKLTGAQLHLYAKIIALACAYTDTPQTPLEFLKTTGKKFDESAIRALIRSLAFSREQGA